MKKSNKRAAIEMTTSTIIIIVLSVLMLVFGSIFVRNVMCSGIIMTQDITQSTSKEIKNLFGSRNYGVVCMGEGNEDITLGSGGTRYITCTFNLEEAATYDLKFDKIESLSGTSQEQVEKWIVGTTGWHGDMVPNAAVNTKSVLTLNIPKGVSRTILTVTLTETSSLNSAPLTHDIRLTVEPVGAVSSAIC